jgi:drug/metabolite transporter (DMT)-like permease
MRLPALSNRGVQAALGSAILFGAGTPFAKVLLDSVSPWLLAGLLYLGSGIGLSIYRLIRRSASVRLARKEVLPLVGAIGFGGVIGPVLLMLGLVGTPASGASLLLNAEGVFTVLLAWFVFKENFDRRVALGMLAIIGGAAVLSWPGRAEFIDILPSLAILGACLAWGIDNNLTRKVAHIDAAWLAATKGVVAGPVNLVIAVLLGAALPPLLNVGFAMLVGFFAYGVSLVLFIVALRYLGTARAGAYYSVAPFFGATIALIMGEPFTVQLAIGGLLMAVGVALHVFERHEHEHTHELPDGGTLTHTHSHYPDSEHRHSH